MKLSKWINKSWYWHSTMILSGVVLMIACNVDTDSGEELSNGGWQITEITGFINDKRETEVPDLCDAYNETYYPILDKDQTYIKFQTRQSDPTWDSPPDVAPIILVNSGDVFIFRFSFDNGYFSNEMLDGSGVQYSYTNISDYWTYRVGYSVDDLVSGEVQDGSPGGGWSYFSVTGIFVSDTRIEGTWSWTENTTLIGAPVECNSHATGVGTWTAVKN